MSQLRPLRWLGTLMLLTGLLASNSLQVMAQEEESEWVPGKYMIQAVGEMLDAADVLQRDLKYGYAEGACMVGVLLQPQGDYTMTRRFEKGIEYAIVAGGDEDASDIDVEILDSKGNVVIKDDSEDRLGVIEWTPTTTGEYRVRVKLFEARIESFCAFTVLRKGGYQIPLQQAVDAAGKFFRDCNGIVSVAEDRGNTVGFLSEDGQAGIWGCVLPRGESLTMTNVIPGEGQAVMLGRGNDDDVDIDIFVMRGDTTIGEDTAEDSFPQYYGEFKDGASYSVMLKNVDAQNETAFVIGGVLRLFPE
ncbi:MAG: hypothetical protein R3B96_01690 [Pirellulaceae bacterium]